MSNASLLTPALPVPAPTALGPPSPAPAVPVVARERFFFDALAATYGWGEWLSGGLLRRWRRQLVSSLRRPARGPARVVDLMAGGAELWPVLRRHFGPELRAVAVDFSVPMLARAAAYADSRLRLCPADALATPLPAGQATAVTCAFGLKTLAIGDYDRLATEAARLLQPGGQLALVELVLPAAGWRRALVLRYLAALLPLLRWLHPAAAPHAALARYARTGPSLPALRQALTRAGFGSVRQRRLWPGCAVLLLAQKLG